MAQRVALACALILVAPAAAEERPPEASSQVRVRLVSLQGDVWGGDGDHVPTVFSLHLELTVHNGSELPVRLDEAAWSMPLGDGLLSGSSKGLPLEVPPGEIVGLRFERYLSYVQVKLLDEDVRSRDERRVRPISGRVDFTIGDDLQYAVFTVEGRWRGAFDPIPSLDIHSRRPSTPTFSWSQAACTNSKPGSAPFLPARLTCRRRWTGPWPVPNATPRQGPGVDCSMTCHD